MMDIPKRPYVPLAARIVTVGQAAHDVAIGIATHADKEHARRGQRLREAEIARRMTEHKVIDVSQL